MRTPEEFWSYVQIGAPNECWPWDGALHRQKDGTIDYGVLNWKGKTDYAHRIAFHLSHPGDTLDESRVLHTCDNPPCCNPTHLVDGDAALNLLDAYVKGHRSHVRTGNQYMTPDQIDRKKEKHGR